MEKISFQPLIAELRDNSTLYNQWYNESEIKYGHLPAQVISGWMVEVVEPIVIAAVSLDLAPEKIHTIVKALYLESLKLIGSGLAIRYKNEYKETWLLMTQMPNLVAKLPLKTISLLNDVVLSLHKYAPEKTLDWCKLLSSSCKEIKTIDDFKITGRIYAWKCGLAHLRSRLNTDFNGLSENLQKTILDNIGSDKNANHLFENPWTENSTKFEGVQGGFKGTTGFFEHPPTLAHIGENIFVTDSKSTYALFADQFGKVLIPANTIDSTLVVSNSKRLENLEKWIGKENELIDSNTILSVVVTKDTLAFTLKDSYFLYLFSLGNA